MAKIEALSDVGSLANTVAARAVINANSERIEEALQNTLSRDGSAPNEMEADIDLNGHYLLNVADASADGDAINLRQLKQLVTDTLDGGDPSIRIELGLPGGADLVQYDVDETVQDRLDALAGPIAQALMGYKIPNVDSFLRSMEARLGERVSILNYIPVAEHAAIKARTSMYDCTTAFIKAYTYHENVFVPAGRYYVTNSINVALNGSLVGEGRMRSTIYVDSAFNMAANGVIVLPASEPSAIVKGIHVDMLQPNVASRAAVTQYPAAIRAVNAPRFMIDDVRIGGSWNGVDATGNSGGGFIGRLEVGALNKGLIIDGSLDFFHVDSYHFWPFGIVNLTTLYNSVYSDQTTKALEVGRCDGLNVSKCSTFRGMVDFTANGTTIEGRHVDSLQLDGDGARLLHTAGALQIGKLYTTKTSGSTNPSLRVSGGRVLLNSLASAVTTAASDVLVDGGVLQISSGFINQNNVAHSAAEVTSGLLMLNGLRLIIPANAVRSKAYVNQTGGALALNACITDTKAAGSGNVVAVAVDNSSNMISGNTLGGWGTSWPASMVLGAYGENSGGRVSFTPALTFATPGDWAPTYVYRSGYYVPTPAGYHFDIRIVVSANAYTTASGGMQITGLPIIHQGVDNIVFPVAGHSKLNLSAGYSDVGAVLGAGNTVLSLTESGDNVGRLGLSPAAIPAGTTNVEINVSGFVMT